MALDFFYITFFSKKYINAQSSLFSVSVNTTWLGFRKYELCFKETWLLYKFSIFACARTCNTAINEAVYPIPIICLKISFFERLVFKKTSHPSDRILIKWQTPMEPRLIISHSWLPSPTQKLSVTLNLLDNFENQWFSCFRAIVR